MTNRVIAGAVWGLRLAGLAVVAAGVSACSMGPMFGAGPDPSAQFANQNATPAQIAQGEAQALPAIATECPPIKVTPGAEALFSYAGRSSDPSALRYQVDFVKQTRNCVVSNGLITVKMGVIGRVLLGPAGKETSVKVPLRFTVERNGTAVFGERYDIPVTITPPAQSAEFVKVVDNVAIPYLGGEEIVIWVGFDSPKGTRPANGGPRAGL